MLNSNVIIIIYRVLLNLLLNLLYSWALRNATIRLNDTFYILILWIWYTLFVINRFFKEESVLCHLLEWRVNWGRTSWYYWCIFYPLVGIFLNLTWIIIYYLSLIISSLSISKRNQFLVILNCRNEILWINSFVLIIVFEHEKFIHLFLFKFFKF